MVSRGKKIVVWWQRKGLLARILLFMLGSALLGFLLFLQRPEEGAAYLESNFLIFAFVNLNVAILCVLIFLVGRNVVKLIFDRRRRILGSQLRMRLVVALVGLTLIPTTILFFLASGLLNRAMEGWFSSQVEASVTGAVEVAKYHYGSIEQKVESAAKEIAFEIQSKQLSLEVKEVLKAFLEGRRNKEHLFGIQLIHESKEIFMEALNAAADIEDFSQPVPDVDTLDKAITGVTSVMLEEKGASRFIRVYVPVRLQGKQFVLLVTHRIDPELINLMSIISDSFKEYEQLKFFRNPLRSGYILTLSMITGLILFAAIWFGFYIARELSIPIQRLAEGTKEVARGNYDFQIRPEGDDEIGFLVRSFNTMTQDLKNSRIDAENKRVFIDTILANIALGVIAVDTRRRITSINASALRLFGFLDEAGVVGGDIREVLTPENYDQLETLLVDIEADSDFSESHAAEEEIRIISQGREARILCTAGQIIDVGHQLLGTVLLFDDITELSNAQQMSAWREVARRIAHEIKNPLTPIQLSAQRLQKLYLKEGAKHEAFEATQTIVEHVDSIKRLADEFSNFARMPTAEFETSILNILISDTIAPYAENNQDIVFQFVAEGRMPDILMDREQIRRVLINLFDNSIAAIRKDREQSNAPERGRIVVRTKYDKKRKTVGFEVADNGPGITDTDKARIFQPYFTTKKEGSGLGLAIVTTVVSDHQGDIRVYDNAPRGAKFIVEFPTSAKGATQRRFAGI
ncbi:ATP-binding protein [Oligoflexia bacterium]|nr:ATP-binding protein [Oligoflexia bacterium]